MWSALPDCSLLCGMAEIPTHVVCHPRLQSLCDMAWIPAYVVCPPRLQSYTSTTRELSWAPNEWEYDPMHQMWFSFDAMVLNISNWSFFWFEKAYYIVKKVYMAKKHTPWYGLTFHITYQMLRVLTFFPKPNSRFSQGFWCEIPGGFQAF